MRGDARSDVHRDASYLALAQLALAGVQAGADGHPHIGQRFADGARAADRVRGAVEGREETVARRVDLAAAEADEMPAHDRVVLAENVEAAGNTRPAASQSV
jgi:hypothetical protein